MASNHQLCSEGLQVFREKWVLVIKLLSLRNNKNLRRALARHQLETALTIQPHSQIPIQGES